MAWIVAGPERTIMLNFFLGFIFGVGLGFAGYRYYLRRNPERLEAIAKRIKAARLKFPDLG